MLVPSELPVVESGGPVGVFRASDGTLCLKVPHGMGGLDPEEALSILYKSLSVFRRTAHARERLAPVDGHHSASSAPGRPTGDDGFTFCDALALDQLFDRADPTRLLAMCERTGRSGRDAHLRIGRHLHRALFDDNGAPYLDSAPGPRRELRYATSDIVALYCFVAEDFYLRFLQVDPATAWGVFASEGAALAQDFRHRYLKPEASLFSVASHSAVELRHLLRYVLATIDRHTVFRSNAYRELYDALDRYLHAGMGDRGGEGLIWGVKDFWAVWESACLVCAANDDIDGFLTCDEQHLPQGLALQSSRVAWAAYRQQVFAHNGIRRRPDLVSENAGVIRVIDFKYYGVMPTRRPKAGDWGIEKLERDFLNLETYGLLLQNHLLKSGDVRASALQLEFWIPATQSSRRAVLQDPAWCLPLTLVGMPTVKLFQGYSQLYQR